MFKIQCDIGQSPVGSVPVTASNNEQWKPLTELTSSLHPRDELELIHKRRSSGKHHLSRQNEAGK
jgi:hypothetical protein